MCVHGCNQVKIEACFTGADDERAAVLYQANQNVCMGKTFCQENSRLVESYSKVSFLEPSFCFHLSACGRSWNINLWDFLTFVFSFVLSFLFLLSLLFMASTLHTVILHCTFLKRYRCAYSQFLPLVSTHFESTEYQQSTRSALSCTIS